MKWIEHRWYGPAAAIGKARAALPQDSALIGALVPPLDEPLRVLDGMAALSFMAAVQHPVPAGVKDDKPQLIMALHGSLSGDTA